MHFPHTLLIGLAALVLWGASRVIAPPLPKKSEDVPALAISGSAYGSLAARTMRGSLYAYWHSGEAYHAPEPVPTPQSPTANTPPPPPPPTPGVFARRRLGNPPAADPAAPANHVATAPPAPAPPAPAPAAEVPVVTTPPLEGPPLDRAAAWLNGLEKRRTQRTDRTPLTFKHLSFLNAATGWRLRLAYNLDPGDPKLYEILYDHILTTSQNIPQARERSKLLTAQALKHARSDQASMSDSLTGCGAAINAFNESFWTVSPGSLPTKEELLANWADISSCQNRFNEIRSAASVEGWWKNIPPMRRAEIDQLAKQQADIIRQIQEFLVKNNLLVSRQ